MLVYRHKIFFVYYFSLFIIFFAIFVPNIHASSQTFIYTGSQQAWTVPTGITLIDVDAFGSAGGNSSTGVGGKGGRIQTTISTIPGETLYINVGGGRYNGGGTGMYNDNFEGGTGGGASDIRQGGMALNNRVVVAGGGGGACQFNGGGGGGTVGIDGNDTLYGGKGGSQSAGGVGHLSQAGSLGKGGNGYQWGIYSAGGGGGGGYYGGSGGKNSDDGAYCGGGGGGSSYSFGINTTHTQDHRLGNGQIVLTYTSSTNSSAPNIPSFDSPVNTATNQLVQPVLKTTSIDLNSDYVRYKIQLCTDASMTPTNCQTFDQTSDQTNWSGQNIQIQAAAAYKSGTQAMYTIQSALSANTTYYWRSYAIDPSGSNTWSSTQVTPSSFMTGNGFNRTFYYTGAQQTWIVPAGVTLITVDVAGASGGIGKPNGLGGNGGRIQTTTPTTPGETLYLYVGGKGADGNGTTGGNGGYNGGANGGIGGVSTGVANPKNGPGGGGGGASDVRQGGTALSNRIIVAGGGGGSGGSPATCEVNGGNGGDTIGRDGKSCSNWTSCGGGGGTSSTGGSAGKSDGTVGICTISVSSTSGVLGVG